MASSNRAPVPLLLASLSLLVVGCGVEISRSNPFDPDSASPAPGGLRGKLLAPTLEDPSGLEVRLLQSGVERATVQTQDDGGFLFAAVQPGIYDLAVDETGFQPLRVYRLEIELGAVIELGELPLVPDVEGDAAAAIVGTVRLEGVPEGEPRHGGVQLRVVGRSFQTFSAPDGSFELPLVEGTHELEATFPDFRPLRLEEVVVGRGERVVLPDQLLLSADPATIHGVVRRRTCEADPSNEEELPAEGALVAALGTGQTAVVAGDGSFAVTGLTAGVHTLRVSLDGHDAREVAGLQVRGGQTIELPAELLLAASKGSIGGRVTLTGELEHAGTIVQLGGTAFVATTASDGSFALEGVCAGDGYELRAVAGRDGFLPAVVAGVTVEPGRRTNVAPLELAPQRGDFLLEGGRAFTRSTRVAYELVAPDGSTEKRVSEEERLFTDRARAEEGWVAITAPSELTLPAGDGTRRLFAQVRGGGATSAVFATSIVLDTTPPSDAQLVIEGGDGTSRDADGVLLTELVASEAPAPGVDRTSGLAFVRVVAVDPSAPPPADPFDPRWEAATALPYQRALDVAVFEPGTDGDKELRVVFEDAAGNRAAPVATIVALDREAPDGTSFEIATTTPGFVSSSVIALALGATDERPGVQFRVSSTAAFAGASWQPLPEPPLVTWFLPLADGPHELVAQFRDAAGNEALPLTASIVLDTTAPSGIRASVSEAPYAPGRTLTVTLVGAGAAEARLSLVPDFTDAAGAPEPWRPFAATQSFTLPDADGPYTLHVGLRDEARNEAAVQRLELTLDRAAPAPAAVDVLEGAFVQAPVATLRLVAVAGPLDAHEQRIDVIDVASGAVVGGTWEPFSPTRAVLLPAPNGTKRIEVFLRDAAGNEAGAPGLAEVTFDPDPPLLSQVTLQGGAAFTNEAEVLVTLDATGADRMTLSTRADLFGAAPQPFAPTVAFTLAPTDGAQTLFVRLEDVAGNEVSGQASIVLDRTAPAPVALRLAGGAVTTRVGAIEVVLEATDALSGVVTVDLSNDPGFGAATTIAWAGAGSQLVPSHGLLPGDGPRTVYARFLDAAGNAAIATATIVVDALAPQANLLVDGGAAYALDADVVLTFVTAGDVVELAVEEGGALDCGSANYEAFASSRPFVLSAGEGAKLVQACLRDAAGNTTLVSDGIQLDLGAPAGSVALADGAAAVATRQLTLALASQPDVVSMAVAVGGALDCGTAVFEAFAPLRAFTLPAGDGLRTIHACFRDGAGRTAQASTTVTLDSTAPVVTLSLDGGVTPSPDGVVDAQVTASDTGVGLARLELSTDPGFALATTQVWPGGASATVPGFALAAGDGPRTVYARVTDAAGNQAVTAATLVVDSTPPTGTLAIDDGASHARGTAVTLRFTAAPDTTHARVADGALADCAGGLYEPYASSRAWTLPVGDGTKLVSACLRDAAGHTTLLSDSIVLDTQPPAGALTLDGGAAFTRAATVTLALTAPPDIAGVALANAASLDCGTATYEPFTAQRSWTLPAGDGPRSVTACLRDAAGNTASTQAIITLDTSPPAGTVSIAGGASHTTTTSVTVTLTWPTDTTGWALADGALDCGVANYTVVAAGGSGTSALRTLPPGDGGKTLVACLRDQAGNVAQASDGIVLDTSPPLGTLTIAAGASYVTSTSVTVTLTAPGDVASMAVVEAASLDCAVATFEAFATTKALVLGGQGVRTVRACFRDAAGLTAAASDEVTVDSIAPTGTLAIDAGAATTRQPQVTLSLVAAADVTAMAIAEGPAFPCSGATYEPFSAARALTLTGGDGTRQVSACLRDAAGNTSSLGDTIVLDTVPPSTATITIAGGATHTTTRAVSLDLTAPETVTVALGADALDCTTATYGALVSPQLFTLADQDGPRSAVACFKDAAGWIVSRSDSIVLDRVAPTGTLAIDAGAGYTQDDLVDLSFVAPADTVEVKVGNGAALDCTTPGYVPYVPTIAGHDLDPANLVANDGTKVVSVCFRDGAGATARSTASIILDRVNPTGTVTAAGGAASANVREVTVELSGVSADVEAMAVAETALACGSAAYSAFSPVTSLTLSDVDGGKTIVVCLRDRAGRTAQVTDVVTLDRVAPSGTLTIAAGASHATSATVTVAGTSADAIGYALANEAIDCRSVAYQAFAASFSVPAHALLALDGTRTVRACLRDGAGNTSVVSDTIVLDTTPPSAPTVLLANGASDSATDTVEVTLTGVDNLGVQSMYLSRNGTFTDGGWIPFAASFTLFDLDGVAPGVTALRTLHVRLSDAAGNVSPTGLDSIVLDLDDPTLTAVSLAGGASAVGSQTVGVLLTASDVGVGTLAELRVSEDPAFAGALWQPYANPLVVTLAAINTTGTIYVQLRDRAGRTSVVRNDSVVVDTLPPEAVSLTLVDAGAAAGFTNENTVGLTLVGRDNLATGADLEVALVNGSALDCAAATYDRDFAGCGASPCTLALAWPHLGIVGTNPVLACLRDAAGNRTAAPIVASIVYDGAGPPAVTELNVVSGSRQLLAAWAEVVDAGPAGIAGYVAQYCLDGFGLVSGCVVPAGPGWTDVLDELGAVRLVTGDSFVLDELQNRTYVKVRVRPVDRAGNVAAAWSPIAGTVPGLASQIVVEGLVDRQAFAPKFTHVENELWMAVPEERSATLDYLSIYRCRPGEQDCAVPGSWAKLRLAPPRELHNFYEGTPLASSTERLWAATIESDETTVGIFDHAIVLWSCDRATGCDAGGEWTRVEVEALSTSVINTHVSVHVGPTRVYAAYHWNFAANDDRPRVASCPLTSDCTNAANWTKATVPRSADDLDDDNRIALATDDAALWVQFQASSGETVVTRCLHRFDCDADGDFLAPYALDGLDDADSVDGGNELVVTRDRLYALHRTQTGAFGNAAFAVARCTLTSGCDASGDWVAAEITPRGSNLRDAVASLAFGGSALHATWHDPDDAQIWYATCDAPDLVDCAAADAWRRMGIDVDTALATVPGMVAYGSNVTIAWQDDFDRLRFVGPSVLSPLRTAIGPGDGELRAQWEPTRFLSGYEHRFGDFPAAGFRSLVADPLARRNGVSVAAGGDHRTGLAAYDEGGELSDGTREFRLRAFRQSGRASSSPDTSTCVSDTVVPQAQWTCGQVVSAAAGEVLVQASSDGSDLWFARCDSAALDCTQNASWTRYEVADTLQGFSVGGLVANAATVYVVASNSIGDVDVWWCPIATGCDAAGEWSTHRVLTGSSYTPRVALGTNLLWVTTRTFAGEVLAHHCNPAGDCTNGASWTKNLAATSGTGTATASYSIAAADAVLGLFQLDGSNLRFFRCSTVACSGSTILTTPTAPLEWSGQLVMSSGTAKPGALVVWGDRLRYVSCPLGSSDCLLARRWGVQTLDRVSLDLGVTTDLVSSGSERYALYSSLDEVRLATCDRHCGQAGRWDVAPVLRELDAWEPQFGLDTLFTMPAAPAGTRLGFGLYPTFDSPDYTHVYYDGVFRPQE